MAVRWRPLFQLVELVRLDWLLSAISNIWLMIFLAWGIEVSRSGGPALPMPLPSALLLGAVIAGGLSIYGVTLNDALDARHDRAFRPHRAVPAGVVGQATLIVVGVLCLLAAVFASALFSVGSLLICVLTAIAILFYNVTGRFFPGVGIVLLGLIRGLNMFIPYPWMIFTWPIWLTMTHVLVCAAIYHVLEGKRPRLGGNDWWGIFAGWTFWTLVLVSWMSWRSHGAPGLVQGRPWLWLGAIIAAALFAVLAWRHLRARMRPLRARLAAGDTFARASMVWLIVYDAVWLLGADLYPQALLHATLFVAAWGLLRLVTWLTHLSSAPALNYRVSSAVD